MLKQGAGQLIKRITPNQLVIVVIATITALICLDLIARFSSPGLLPYIALGISVLALLAVAIRVAIKIAAGREPDGIFAEVPHGTLWLLRGIIAAVLVAGVTVISVDYFLLRPGRANIALEQAVKNVVAAQNKPGDNTAELEKLTCGTVREQVQKSDTLVQGGFGTDLHILKVEEFQFTNATEPAGYTVAKVLVGVPGDPGGNTTRVALFVLAVQDDGAWATCNINLVI